VAIIATLDHESSGHARAAERLAFAGGISDGQRPPFACANAVSASRRPCRPSVSTATAPCAAAYWMEFGPMYLACRGMAANKVPGWT